MAVKKKTRKRRQPTLRSVLNDIEKVLSRHDQLSQDVWDVLSALRGPDTEGSMAKGLTVSIRRAAFPKLAAYADDQDAAIAGSIFADWGASADFELDLNRIESGHFRQHIRSATRALKLLPTDPALALLDIA